MYKKFLTFCFAAMTCVSAAYAQDAKMILDRTAAHLKGAGGIQARFEATQFKGNQAAGTTEGNIQIAGEKFKISSPALTTWFDGKTQWTLLSGSDEVNVSAPSPSEQQALNPYTFVNLYRSGYAYDARSTTYDGKPCYEVRLLAKDAKKEIPEMRLMIDNSYNPLSIRVKQKQGNWLRIRVSGLRLNQKFGADTFRFNPKEHPKAQIIDLR